MKKIDSLLTSYGESHQNHLNKWIHWICVPAIMFSLIGLVMRIPFFGQESIFFNWATVLLILALLYYLKLSVSLFIGFLFISFLLLFGNVQLTHFCNQLKCNPSFCLLSIFVLAWIGQFIGHSIEGRRPSFMQDLQFLLIGPAWLLHFIYKKLGIPY